MNAIEAVRRRTGQVTKEEALAARETVSEPFRSIYLMSVDDIEAEFFRLTKLLAARVGDSCQRRALKVRLQALGAERWPEALCEVYEKANKARDRREVVTSAISDARESSAARQLGTMALSDRSFGVRDQAAQLLAYGLDRSVLPSLRAALDKEKRATVRQSMAAAIKAIEEQNHHLFLDRQNSGKSHWGVNPWDCGEPPIQRGILCFELEKIKEGWETDV